MPASGKSSDPDHYGDSYVVVTSLFALVSRGLSMNEGTESLRGPVPDGKAQDSEKFIAGGWVRV